MVSIDTRRASRRLVASTRYYTKFRCFNPLCSDKILYVQSLSVEASYTELVIIAWVPGWLTIVPSA
jgi:hypothetical protein